MLQQDGRLRTKENFQETQSAEEVEAQVQRMCLEAGLPYSTPEALCMESSHSQEIGLASPASLKTPEAPNNAMGTDMSWGARPRLGRVKV